MNNLYQKIIDTIGQQRLADCVRATIPDSADPVGYARNLKTRQYIPPHFWPALADAGCLRGLPKDVLQAAEIEYWRNQPYKGRAKRVRA